MVNSYYNSRLWSLNVAVKSTYYFSCFRDGDYYGNPSERKTEKKRLNQKPLRKLNAVCLSRMYVNEYYDNHVEVDDVSAHTNHELGAKEMPYLPLPSSVKEVAEKVNIGIPSQRILKGIMTNNECFL